MTDRYNESWMLPVVGVWFYILFENKEIKVMRNSYISNREDNLVYFDMDENKYEGKFPWRHA